MEYKRIPYTEKFPYNYIVMFDDGVSVSTTDLEKFAKLRDIIGHKTQRFFDLDKKMQRRCEMAFRVVKPRL